MLVLAIPDKYITSIVIHITLLECQQANSCGIYIHKQENTQKAHMAKCCTIKFQFQVSGFLVLIMPYTALKHPFWFLKGYLEVAFSK